MPATLRNKNPQPFIFVGYSKFLKLQEYEVPFSCNVQEPDMHRFKYNETSSTGFWHFEYFFPKISHNNLYFFGSNSLAKITIANVLFSVTLRMWNQVLLLRQHIYSLWSSPAKHFCRTYFFWSSVIVGYVHVRKFLLFSLSIKNNNAETFSNVMVLPTTWNDTSFSL